MSLREGLDHGGEDSVQSVVEASGRHKVGESAERYALSGSVGGDDRSVSPCCRRGELVVALVITSTVARHRVVRSDQVGHPV